MQYESETGQYYTSFRQYDPNQGRWMSVNPLDGSALDPRSVDRYTYVINDPVDLVDPDGLDPECGEGCRAQYAYRGDNKRGPFVGCSCPGGGGLVDVYPCKVTYKNGFYMGNSCHGTSGGFERPDRDEIEPPDIGKPPIPPDTLTPLLQNCPPVPPGPGVNELNANMALAASMGADKLPWGWFYDKVKTGGPWDYKQQNTGWQAFGNFNYGATGAAAGFSAEVVLRAAGAAQMQTDFGRLLRGKRRIGQGSVLGGSPYGDDPRDQFLIQLGIDYFKNDCYGQ